MTAPVAIIMGSQSDWATMKHAADMLDQAGVAMVPGEDFGQHEPQRYLRVSYATGMAQLQDAVERLRRLLINSERGARLRLSDGPPMLRSENARLSGWVYVDIRGRELRSAVLDMQRVVAGCRNTICRLPAPWTSSRWPVRPPSSASSRCCS